jgi:type VI protein secretion system component VasK
MAEKVVSVMNSEELRSMIFSSYEQDAKTLATDNEANLLKLKELLGELTPQEQQRWEAIKYAFVENVRMQGMTSDNQVGQVLRQLASMRDGLESFRQVIARAIAHDGDRAELRMDQRFDSLKSGLTGATDRIASALEPTGQQLRSISQTQAANPPEQHVTVQHTVPRVMLDLIQVPDSPVGCPRLAVLVMAMLVVTVLAVADVAAIDIADAFVEKSAGRDVVDRFRTRYDRVFHCSGLKVVIRNFATRRHHAWAGLHLLIGIHHGERTN